jgi:hypothetical protein
MKKLFFFTILLFTFMTEISLSQSLYNPVIFNSDSLKGFDESAAVRLAISEDFLGAELKVKLLRLQREFIDNKYGISHSPLINLNTYSLNLNRPSAATNCVNEDFEVSNSGPITPTSLVTGWTVDEGYNGLIPASSTSSLLSYFPGGLLNPSSCNLLGCCPMPSQRSEIVDCSAPGGFVDPIIGTQYPIFSVFGTGTVSGATAVNPHIPGGLFGNKVLRLNNTSVADYSIARLSKSFFVTQHNSFFQFAFITVFAPGHSCCDAGAIQINFKDSLNSIFACPNYSFSAASAQCTNTIPYTYYNTGSGTTYSPNVNFGNIYNPWNLNSIDFSSNLGQTITMELIVSDCNAGGHFGYAYFDAQCAPLKLMINDSIYSLSDPQINYSSCETQFTVSAPSGIGPVLWAGPSGFTSTNSIISGSMSGTYTLIFGQGVFCSPIIKTININLFQNIITISNSDSLLCNGNTAILKVLGVINCTWTTGQTNPIIFVTPTVTTTYSVSGMDNNGCTFTSSITQSVSDCMGISSINYNTEAILIFPNPNNGEFWLNIKRPLISAEFILFNEAGQEVHKQKVNKDKNLVQTKDLSPGIYYYSITENKKVVAKGKVQLE